MIRLALVRFLENYFRHRWLHLLPIALLIGGAIAYVLLSVPTYESTGTLYVRKESLLASLTAVRQDGYVWSTAATVAASDLKELIETESFVRAVINESDLRTQMTDPIVADDLIDKYRRSIEFTALGDNLVKFTVTYDQPQIAYQLATGTVKIYKSWRLNIDKEESRVAQDFFTNVMGPYQTELQNAQAALDDYLVQHPDPVRGERPMAEQVKITQLQDAVRVATERLQSAMEKEESARLAASQAESDVNQTYILVDEPVVPTETATRLKDWVLRVGIFVVVGVILSLVAIGGGTLMDRTLRLPVDVRYELGLPVLARIGDRYSLLERSRRKLGKQNTSTSTDASITELRLEDSTAQSSGN